MKKTKDGPRGRDRLEVETKWKWGKPMSDAIGSSRGGRGFGSLK